MKRDGRDQTIEWILYGRFSVRIALAQMLTKMRTRTNPLTFVNECTLLSLSFGYVIEQLGVLYCNAREVLRMVCSCPSEKCQYHT
jgi:hypothetical protein